MLGISVSMIMKIKGGKRQPSEKVLFKLDRIERDLEPETVYQAKTAAVAVVRETGPGQAAGKAQRKILEALRDYAALKFPDDDRKQAALFDDLMETFVTGELENALKVWQSREEGTP